MNSKQFLSQLLAPSSTIPAANGQECTICQEEYNVRSSDISTAEKQIRLPCNPKHTVGANCIVKWLQANNTCPICRYEFFPKEGKKSNSDRERTMELLVSLLEDGDENGNGEVVDQDGDVEDEDFVDEESEEEDDDVNMSDEDEGMSEEDD